MLTDANSEGLIRVIDETGEDYLFPEEYFVPIDLPSQIQKSFERTVRELQCHNPILSTDFGDEAKLETRGASDVQWPPAEENRGRA